MEDVVERMRNRLGRWKGKFVSMTCRICLIKSMLSSLPLFHLSLYRMPVIVTKEIVKLQRKFLWDWGSERRKIAWASCCLLYTSDAADE